MTSVDALPRAALPKRSISAAIVYGSCPLIATDFSPFAPGALPTRTIWAPPAAPDPVGASVPRASALADGNDEPLENRSGAFSGGPAREAAAIAPCQLSLGTIVTTWGWVPLP